jgi:hypothetical protein
MLNKASRSHLSRPISCTGDVAFVFLCNEMLVSRMTGPQDTLTVKDCFAEATERSPRDQPPPLPANVAILPCSHSVHTNNGSDNVSSGNPFGLVHA